MMMLTTTSILVKQCAASSNNTYFLTTFSLTGTCVTTSSAHISSVVASLRPLLAHRLPHHRPDHHPDPLRSASRQRCLATSSQTYRTRGLSTTLCTSSTTRTQRCGRTLRGCIQPRLALPKTWLQRLTAMVSATIFVPPQPSLLGLYCSLVARCSTHFSIITLFTLNHFRHSVHSPHTRHTNLFTHFCPLGSSPLATLPLRSLFFLTASMHVRSVDVTHRHCCNVCACV
jgi:hypothetical protein